jgi:hypothetical protein
MAVEDFSGKLVSFHQETWQQITEDGNLHSHNSVKYKPHYFKMKMEAPYSFETLPPD